jgi:hypothetical protein
MMGGLCGRPVFEGDRGLVVFVFSATPVAAFRQMQLLAGMASGFHSFNFMATEVVSGMVHLFHRDVQSMDGFMNSGAMVPRRGRGFCHHHSCKDQQSRNHS